MVKRTSEVRVMKEKLFAIRNPVRARKEEESSSENSSFDFEEKLEKEFFQKEKGIKQEIDTIVQEV